MLRFSFLLALPTSSSRSPYSSDNESDSDSDSDIGIDTSSLAPALPSPKHLTLRPRMKRVSWSSVRKHPRYSIRVLGLVAVGISLVVNTTATNAFYYYVVHGLTVWAYLPVCLMISHSIALPRLFLLYARRGKLISCLKVLRQEELCIRREENCCYW